MTTRYLYLLGAALLLFLLAFSTGSPAFLAPAVLFSLLLLYAPVSVRLARRGMKMHLQFLQDRVRRGDQAELHITAAYRSLLPVSPIQLQISIGEDMPLQPLEIPCSAQAHSFSLLFSTRHAGVIRPKVNSCRIRDIFGIYAREYGSFRDLPELLVRRHADSFVRLPCAAVIFEDPVHGPVPRESGPSAGKGVVIAEVV